MADKTTTLEAVLKDTSGNAIKKSVTYANTEKDNETLAEFMGKLNALTTNTIDSITRVNREKIG